ncbi:LpxL/LpxP family acyltransferase [Kaarinaea lacus]
MNSANQESSEHTLTIRSESLYSGEFTVTEDASFRSGKRFSGTRLKAILVPILYKSVQHLPIPIAAMPMRLLLLLLRLFYTWPNNSFRQACEYICNLAAAKGYDHDPKQVYRQLIKNANGTLDNYFRLYRHGVESVLDRIHIAKQDAERMNRLTQDHGGVVIAVPHNFASLFSAVKMNREFPLICISRNPSTIERTKIAVDIFERMGVTILLVRGGNPFELSRTMFSILKSGKTIAATVDSMDHSDGAAQATVFGQAVGFPTWAAKIAAKKKIPVVPSYFRSDGKQVTAVYGEELISDSTEEIVQHYVSFFEKNILEDPASWAYLGDKRWRRVLSEASKQE